jgi:hypothetical protein
MLPSLTPTALIGERPVATVCSETNAPDEKSGDPVRGVRDRQRDRRARGRRPARAYLSVGATLDSCVAFVVTATALG